MFDLERLQKQSGIIGTSLGIRQVLEMIMQISPVDISVLVTGESGTGKEVVAKAIHKFSKRKNEEMVVVNCGAIPEGIIESELFGHKKGSFTGAGSDRKGYFEQADRGTIFLDEIGEAPLETQVKLLRVLESGEIERVGGAETIRIDVRIISATNQPLDRKILDGSFRQDLYHRINVFPITIPPLRDRKEDIAPTVMTILKGLKKKHNISVNFISHNAMKRLVEYDWPGNVREMENTLERIVLIHDNPLIRLENIDNILKKNTDTSTKLSEKSKTLVTNKRDLHENLDNAQEQKVENLNEPVLSKINTPMTLKELEKIAILAGLKRANWNMSTAAQQLGISRMTLYRKLTQHNINKDG